MKELLQGKICGLCKTSRLIDTDGRSILNKLISKKGKWYYPYKESMIVRLHEQS